MRSGAPSLSWRSWLVGEPDLPFASALSGLPDVLVRDAGLERRHLDAAGSPRLARAGHTWRRTRSAWHHDRAPIPAVPALGPVRRGARGPPAETPPAHRHQRVHGSGGADARASGRHGHGPGVARLRARILAGCRWSTRQPGSEDVRRRTGRARRRTERSWPEQRVVSYCTVGWARSCRAAHCSSRAGPGLPAQRADIRRADSRAADDRTGRFRFPGSQPIRPEPPGRPPVRVRASGCGHGARDHVLRRYVRHELPDDHGADGDRSVRAGP